MDTSTTYPAQPAAPTPVATPATPTVSTGSSQYAGFWIRVVAALIDAVIVTVVNFVVGFVIGLVIGFANPSTAQQTVESITPLLNLIGIVINVGYVTFFLLKKNATLGKMAVGLKVVTVDGSEKLTVGRILLREVVGKFVSGVILGIGYLMVAWDSKKQGLHDKIAGTVVVRK